MYRDTFKNTNEYQYIPTGKYLKPEDIELLKKEKLGGKVSFDLYQLHKDTLENINNFKEVHQIYPSKAQLLEKKTAKGKTVVEFIEEYKQHIKTEVSGTSHVTYCSMLQNVLERLPELMKIDKKQYIYNADLFVAESTVKRICDYYIELGFGNGYVLPMKRLLVRCVNFIRKSKGMNDIELNMKLAVNYEHVKLSEDEMRWILSHPVTKAKDIECITILKLNAVLGLRINEILSLHAEDIVVQTDGNYMLTISEKKKNRTRQVIVVSDEGIKLLIEIKKKTRTGKLFMLTKDTVNYRIKRIAKDSKKFNQLVKRMKNVGKNVVEVRIPKYKCISTHSFRRFRIRKNIKEHGLLVGQYYSGHTNLATIQKHYVDKLEHSEIITLLGGDKKKQRFKL